MHQAENTERDIEILFIVLYKAISQRTHPNPAIGFFGILTLLKEEGETGRIYVGSLNEDMISLPGTLFVYGFPLCFLKVVQGTAQNERIRKLIKDLESIFFSRNYINNLAIRIKEIMEKISRVKTDNAGRALIVNLLFVTTTPRQL